HNPSEAAVLGKAPQVKGPQLKALLLKALLEKAPQAKAPPGQGVLGEGPLVKAVLVKALQGKDPQVKALMVTVLLEKGLLEKAHWKKSTPGEGTPGEGITPLQAALPERAARDGMRLKGEFPEDVVLPQRRAPKTDAFKGTRSPGTPLCAIPDFSKTVLPTAAAPAQQPCRPQDFTGCILSEPNFPHHRMSVNETFNTGPEPCNTYSCVGPGQLTALTGPRVKGSVV
ncbi:Leucine--tRNA ligase, partial [Frankliniella fusca]